MPRTATKAQTEKRRRKSSILETTHPMQAAEDRFTRAQWAEMLTLEDADEAVAEIMNELMSRVMKGCWEVYIKRQLEPYTVSWAKSYLTQFLEHNFLWLDEGEGPEVGAKTEDSEPMPATLDAWIEGCMPVLTRHHHTSQVANTGQVPVETFEKDSQQCHVTSQANSLPKQAEKETSPMKPVSEMHRKILSHSSLPKTERKKKQHSDLPPKHVPGTLLPPLSCSPEPPKHEKMDAKNKEHSVNNLMTRSLDLHQKYRPLQRLDPCCLPQYNIVLEYEIVDDDRIKPSSKKPSRLSRLELGSNK
ncbi:uncharacterized protein C2orf81 homolog isoform 2-T3 [Pholidichthys leucotaenia]